MCGNALGRRIDPSRYYTVYSIALLWRSMLRDRPLSSIYSRIGSG